MGHGTWDMGRFSRSGSLSFPEKVDFVLILVDSKCNFVTCEFVTISTFSMQSRIVILIYNILYIYINYYLPSSISNLLNVTKSKVTKYNLCNLSLIRLIVFRVVRTVRSFVCSLQPPRSLLPTPGVQPFVPLSAPHPLRAGSLARGAG